ncbi:N-6 DNA methylase [Picosynechococcus sp. NKBG042902]|uniref:N-6 DNA methylase n=1 Tax=Picosynechococcus sp. NKBG042902 TaxID=490193 RepID=UPI0004AB70E3|nr:N-6 DNA methylase [Picosynechococcus sp. NKBG042902]
MQLADILKDSEYKLSQFEPEDLDWLEDSIFLKTVKKVEKPYIKCLIRNKDIQLKPEEIVRQLYLKVLIDRYGYPSDRIIVEYPVKFGTETKKADIAIMDVDRPTVPYVIVELKKPKEKAGKDQLKSYCNATGAPIGVWTNGDSISRWHRKDPNYFERITDIPKASQTLEDILQIKFTLEDLIQNDRLVNEKMSLRALIEEMEDEVLANAGVDVFEEVFKLIFTKLYDEWLSGQGSNRNKRILEFRNTGQTETALKNKIQDLFDRAKEKWEGVFSEDSKITLTPSHLSVCVRSLENVKLFNSNLDVIDEAFEYLVNQSSKGEKGQYFTPRYVIDMCVKMLNPQEDEYMINTAAGSSGFPVHTIFHVWKQILEDEGIEASHLFTIEEKPHRCTEYVEKRVFAIDFDEKSVRVARTLNLIAGDGQTNVMRLNTLDYDGWDEITKEESWNDTYNDGFKRLKKLRKNSNSYKEFKFDVLMANPPFAGDIKEGRIIHKYALSKKPNGKWQTKVGRDILFIERNLDFLKPGGRMAIVLPQGRFNNSSDKQIREFIAERCRILAVVGLHGNTFKPHTGTKTSVLLVQKWNDDPRAGALCPRQDDYNIFFATMQKSGKDNSGEKIYRRIVPPDEEGLSEKEKDRDLLLDEHQHLVIDHDLFNHEGLTEDSIAEAFMEFAKKEKLSFFEQSPFVTPFSKDKYERLMDGLEASEVLLSETLKNKDFRVDSEFHRKPPLKNQKYEYVDIGKHLTLVQYGISIEMNEEGEGTKIYRMNEIHNMLCDIDVLKSAKISSIEIEKYKLKERDILFNRTNSFDLVGRTGLFKISSDREFVFASYLIRVRTDESKILPEYLVAFLNSNLGIWDIKRRARISINQSNVNSQELAAVKIPLLNREFQLKLKEIFDRAHLKRLESIKTYQEAEDLLLSELGLKDWELTEETVAVKRFSESFLLGDARLDAEYYQPKYDQLIERIEEKVQLDSLGNLLSLNQRGKQPQYVEEKNGLTVVNSKHVREGEVIVSDNRYAQLPDGKNAVVIQTNDVLINGTGVGTIGRCAPYLYEECAIPDNHVTILRTEFIDPVYLSIFLNSIVGKYQVEKHFKGSSGQIELYPNEINQFLVWNAPKFMQKSIRDKVEESHQKSEQSKQLLEIAKHGVEKAIETDEETAIHWINQESEKLKIKLPSLT